MPKFIYTIKSKISYQFNNISKLFKIKPNLSLALKVFILNYLTYDIAFIISCVNRLCYWCDALLI